MTLWQMAAEAVPADLPWLTEFAPVLDLGLSGLLFVTLLYMLRKRDQAVSSGEWVSRRELDYMREVYEGRLADKNQQIERALYAAGEWRAAHETSERTRELLNAQVRDFAEAFRTHGVFFDAFRDKIINGSIVRTTEDESDDDTDSVPAE